MGICHTVKLARQGGMSVIKNGLDLVEGTRSVVFSVLYSDAVESVCMLRITTETKRGKTILSVEGRIAGPSISILEQCWRELCSASPRQKLSGSPCGVGFIYIDGKGLLKEKHRRGANLLAEGCLNQAIVNEIVESEKHAPRSAKSGKGSIIFYIALVRFFFSHSIARAQANTALPGPGPSQAMKLTLEQAVALAVGTI